MLITVLLILKLTLTHSVNFSIYLKVYFIKEKVTTSWKVWRYCIFHTLSIDVKHHGHTCHIYNQMSKNNKESSQILESISLIVIGNVIVLLYIMLSP